jgi:hypothetical protein
MFEYAEKNGLTHQEPLIQITKRTTQEYIKRAATAASDETGNNDFELVSSLDLRVFFAKQAIERWRVHPRVVMRVCGWGNMDTLIEHLDEPTEMLVVREFDRAEFHGMGEWVSDIVGPPETGVEQVGIDEY